LAELYPPEATRAQVQEMTTEQMAGSQHAAATVALRALGKPERAVVAQVAPAGPAAGILRVGDLIESVADTPITTTPDVSRLVQAAGDRVAMSIERSGESKQLSVPTKVVQGRRMVGVALEAKFDPSIKVTIDAGDVGGPSAGMMFALAVYDKITPGPLTGGRKIAGTGTMAIDGSVGPIGGITHKLVGAKNAGAQWFLAPAQDCSEVVGQIPDGLSVAKVATFEEARVAVQSIAAGTGATLATCG
ncbi:MAG: PDZ domain-containing protein, partial [Micrococcales bacterium]|nr:PDZ domain-containing protein [Micrococcales bacterium]